MASRKAPDYEEVSPYLLIREIGALARNEVPPSLLAYCETTGMAAWELLEEAVFFFFRQVLMVETIRLGDQMLFTQEPEGIVVVNRERPFGILYECKSRRESYRMTSDDLLRYREYIDRQRQRVRHKQHVELTHFVIVSSGFEGDTDERLKRLHQEGVVPCLVRADLIATAYRMIRHLEYADVQLLDLRRLLQRGIIALAALHDCICGLQCLCPEPENVASCLSDRHSGVLR